MFVLWNNSTLAFKDNSTLPIKVLKVAEEEVDKMEVD